MLPCPGYYKQCCDEHWGTHVCFNSGFLSVYAQQWDCPTFYTHSKALLNSMDCSQAGICYYSQSLSIYFIHRLCCCCCCITLVVSNSVRPQRRQPTRLPRPWDSPGKNTGVGCHFLLQCMKVKSESEVAQSCPTLATPRSAAHQAPLSMGFSRQKYWSGVPLPSPKLMTNCL